MKLRPIQKIGVASGKVLNMLWTSSQPINALHRGVWIGGHIGVRLFGVRTGSNDWVLDRIDLLSSSVLFGVSEH